MNKIFGSILSRVVVLFVFSLILHLWQPASAAGATYTVTNIGAQISGNGYGSVGTSLNNSDQVVGYYNSSSATGAELPFLYTPGSGAITIPNVNANFVTQASSINDSGVTVGDGVISGSNTQYQQGFTYNSSNGSFSVVSPIAVVSGTDIPNLNLVSINSAGLAVGYSYTNSNSTSYRAITYNTATKVTTDIGTSFSGPTYVRNAGGNSNQAFSINDKGVIAGYGPNTGGAQSVSTTKDFYYATPGSNGSYTFTDFTAAVTAVDPAYQGPSSDFIDAQGNIAGGYVLGSTSYGGFLYNIAAGTAVSITHGQSTSVEGITDVGGVPNVFGYFVSGSTRHAFIYANGVFTDEFSSLASGYTLNEINAINSRGDIVAVGTANSGGNAESLLLVSSAVPEPAGFGTLIITAAVLLRRRNSRACVAETGYRRAKDPGNQSQ